MPLAKHELSEWHNKASLIPDESLRVQALASLQHKRFHADGGCVYAAVYPTYSNHLVKAIVSLQTISDYLDNLCDRCDTYDEQDFIQLHHAMREAVRPGAASFDYYLHRPQVEDGGYLSSLVTCCQSELAQLPGYPAVQSHMEWLVERYCELQAIKHIVPAERARRLQAWWTPFQPMFPDLHWWEFAAATGSTLGMFSLMVAATQSMSVLDAEQLFQLYFPSVCGLHILLDYLIDLEEDRIEGDFNFVACYADADEMQRRIAWFAKTAAKQTKHTPDGLRIHHDVVCGLLAMYLSDKKVVRQELVRPHLRLVWQFGPKTWMYFWACILYRRVRGSFATG